MAFGVASVPPPPVGLGVPARRRHGESALRPPEPGPHAGGRGTA